jgi:hypothetical protein
MRVQGNARRGRSRQGVTCLELLFLGVLLGVFLGATALLTPRFAAPERGTQKACSLGVSANRGLC